jgi:hypothetical protein
MEGGEEEQMIVRIVRREMDRALAAQYHEVSCIL